MSKFGSDRTSSKKMQNKILLVVKSEYQKFFASQFFSTDPIFTKI